MINKKCEICNGNFKVYKYREFSTKTCSDACRSKRHSLINSGKVSKGWLGLNGYRYLMVEGKEVLEHRHIVETHYGIKLGKDKEVHHKNGVRSDNRIENLEVMEASDHAKLSAIEGWKTRRCATASL